jgi:acyl dehydratase
MPAQVGGVAVNPAMIRQFCGLTEDANPSYWNAEYAATRWGGLVSPPAMLLTWALALDWTPDCATGQPPLCLRVPLPGDTLINVSQGAELRGPIRVGERLAMTEELVDLSEEKRTRLGPGHFVTTRGVFRQVDGTVVGELTNVLFRFTAGVTPPAPDLGHPPPDPPAAGGGAEVVPGYDLHMPYRKVVTSPAATLDYFPLFYDRDYARAQGHPTVIVNTMVLLGLVDRLVTDWAGPGTFIAAHHLAVLLPVYAGDTVALTGRVRERRDGMVTVDAEISRASGEVTVVCGRATVTAQVAE